MILVCGESLFDVFVEPDAATDNKDSVMSLRAIAGGSPFNVAIGLARLGCKVALSTEVGHDAFGKKIISLLAQEGIDLSLVCQTDQSTPLALVEANQLGVPAYCFVGLKDVQLHPNETQLGELPEPVSIVHIGSYALVSPQSADALYDAVTQYAERALISLDPNIRLQAEPDIAVWRSAIERFRAQAHLIKVSTEDLVALYGAEADVEAIAQQWLSDRCQLVILTGGEAGASFFSCHQSRIEVPARQVNVVDTVGAGDGFQAATLGWLDRNSMATAPGLARLSQDRLSDLGCFAAHVASLVCERNGPNFPRLSELPDDLVLCPGYFDAFSGSESCWPVGTSCR